MILLLIIQVISIQGALDVYNGGDKEQAFQISMSITDTTGFEQDELTELRAFLAMEAQRYELSDSLFNIVIQSPYDSIRRKAYTNYAELHHKRFNFNKRLHCLQKAFDLKPTPQLIRIIARHYFQIEADYDKAQTWIERHHTPQTDKDQAGFDLLQAEFAESKRQYSEAIRYYQQAKTSSHKAGLFNYELFSAKGLYRVERLKANDLHENMKYLFIYAILYLGYRTFKYYRNERTNADI